MNRLANAGLLAGLMSLTACGGAGSSIQSASSTPDANTQAVASLATGSETTNATTLTGTFTDPDDRPSNVVTAQTTGAAPGVTLSYDSATRSYTIRIAQGGVNETITYGPGERDRTPDRPGFIEFERRLANGTDADLLLRVPGSAGSNLSHVGYGIWDSDQNVSTTADLERWAFFVFGQRTPASDVPTSGTATYNGTVDGLWTSATASYLLSGSAQLLADFAAGTVRGDLNISGRNRETNLTTAMDRLAGTAALNRARGEFSGNLTGTSGFAGTWNGTFFGPRAREAGGTFSVTRGAEAAVGVFTAGQ